ncbi:MAG: hypothetical protein JWQ11_190 [Rhizobacter sp.]|nr:hypothetical protein [Rhizobacter sp.]
MHHFTIVGLPNVWLVNGYTLHKTAYGPGISYSELDQLWHLLCMQLVRKPGRLTGKEFRYLRSNLELSQAIIAKRQGVSEQAVSLWERHGKVPKANDALIRLYYLAERGGDITLKEAVGRLNAVERTVHQEFVARLTRSKWTLKVETDDRASSSRSTSKQSSKAVKATKVAVPGKATEAAMPIMATGVAKATKSTRAPRNGETTGATRPAKPTKPTKPTRPAKASKVPASVTTAKAATVPQATKATKTLQVAAAPRAIKPGKAATPIRPVKPIALVKPGRAVKPALLRGTKTASREPAYA